MHTDPVELFLEVLARLRDDDWSAVAALCDAESLEDFKRAQLASLAEAPPTAFVRNDQYLIVPLDSTYAEAEQHLEELAVNASLSQRLARDFEGIDSLDALRDMPAAELFARALQRRSPRAEYERRAGRGEFARDDDLARDDFARRSYDVEPLGAVEDTGALAHIVFRRRALRGETSVATPQLATCRKGTEGGYLMLASNPLFRTNEDVIIRWG